MPISGFAGLIGMPVRSYRYRRAKLRAGDPPKGPRPAPVVDRIEPQVAKLAAEWPAWGHGKIWARAAVTVASWAHSQVWPGPWIVVTCCNPVTIRPNAHQLAAVRRAVFVDPAEPDLAGRFHRVRNTTIRDLAVVSGLGLLLEAGVILHAHTDQTAADLCAAFDAAIQSAELLLGCPLIEDCVNVETGELEPLVIVTDNGPAMKSIAVARWFKAGESWLRHVRTKHRSPHINAVVVERWNQSLKYERLYRHEIADVIDLSEHIDDYLVEYNEQQPHEAIGWQRPLDRHLEAPNY